MYILKTYRFRDRFINIIMFFFFFITCNTWRLINTFHRTLMAAGQWLLAVHSQHIFLLILFNYLFVEWLVFVFAFFVGKLATRSRFLSVAGGFVWSLFDFSIITIWSLFFIGCGGGGTVILSEIFELFYYMLKGKKKNNIQKYFYRIHINKYNLFNHF